MGILSMGFPGAMNIALPSLDLIYRHAKGTHALNGPKGGMMWKQNTEDPWRISWKGMVFPNSISSWWMCWWRFLLGDFDFHMVISMLLCLLLVGYKDFFQWKGNVSKIPYTGDERNSSSCFGLLRWFGPFLLFGVLIDCRIWCWHGFQVEWVFKWLMSYPPWN